MTVLLFKTAIENKKWIDVEKDRIIAYTKKKTVAVGAAKEIL